MKVQVNDLKEFHIFEWTVFLEFSLSDRFLLKVGRWGGEGAIGGNSQKVVSVFY